MPQNILSLRRFSMKRTLTIVFVCSFILIPIILQNTPTKFGNAHSTLASPKEIFSLWNDSAPLLDGVIGFSSIDLSAEWSAAAVYSMFDDTGSPSSKLILQNDDTNLYIGLDMTEYQVADPASRWGCAVYLDRDHNGVFSLEDRSIVFMKNFTGQFIFYNQYQEGSNPWLELENGLPGIALGDSNILVDHDFTGSYFESNDHHQYEIRIPLSILQIAPGNVTGFAAEGFDDYSDLTRTKTWPEYTSPPGLIFNTPSGWGDLYLGKDTSLANIYADYVYEENLNIKTSAFGPNNGTFLATGDIDGDSDQELIVGSNRTVSGDDNLLAIYDYISGDLQQIWSSWTHPSHQLNMILPTGIATFDFDNNGEDEIYICSNDSRILRFFDWNSTATDFDSSEYTYDLNGDFPGRKLMGYLSIGDPDSDLLPEITVGDDNGDIQILSYNIGNDNFDLDRTWTPSNVLGNSVSRIHAIEVADIGDADAAQETLYLAQFSSDDTLSPTALQIIEWGAFNFQDNPAGEDDLPTGSSTTTVDAFGHSILVDDVDNDAVDEIIIVGQYFLKVFGRNTFTNPSPPLQIGINDNSSQPLMGGGATIGDVDNDGKKELLIGFNNGTLLILNVTDSGSDNLSYTVEWSSDIGASPGKRESMIIFDYDEDSENEALIGDYSGQILALGSSAAPVVTITSPSQSSTKTDTSVLITWNAVEDYAMHHFDVYVNGLFIARAGGGQTGMTIYAGIGLINLRVNGFDVTGKNDSHAISFIVSLDAPEITIHSPPNNHIQMGLLVNLVFEYYDFNDDFNHFEIYYNGTKDDGNLPESTTMHPLILPGAGNWNITILGVDDALNTGKEMIYVIIDTVDPIVSITSPLDGSAINGPNVLLQWSASDERSGIDYFEISKDGVLNATITSSFQDISLEIDKDYVLEVKAIDYAGNEGTDTIVITKDTINPTVTITSPTNLNYTELTTLNLQWDSSDSYGGTGIDYTEVTVNGAQEYSGGLQTAIIDLGGEGVKNIIVTSYDEAGNSGQDFMTIIVDSSNPVISIVSPVDNYNTSFDQIIVYWISSDAGSGIKQYQVFINGGPTPFALINDSDTTYISIPIPLEQTYTITVRAIDYLDHQFEDTIQVTHNSSLEDFAITEPIPPHYYSPTTQVYFEWEVANLVNLSYFEIYINGTLNQTINDNTTRFFNLNLDDTPFDVYNITIVAYTVNPNAAYTDMRWIHIDQLNPTVTINLPLNDSVIYDDMLYLEWSSSDIGSSIVKYIVKLDGVEIKSWDYFQSSQYLHLAPAVGYQTITIDVIDMASNFANDTISIQVFLLLPEFSIDLPALFYHPNGTFDFDISITNTRSGVKCVFVYIDGSRVNESDYTTDIQLTPFIIPISVTSSDYTQSPGAHTLNIIVVDIYDRDNTLSRTFNIDGGNPSIASVTINDQTLSDGSSGRIDVVLGSSVTNITIEAIVSDNYRLNTVTVYITSSTFDEVYLLTPSNDSTPLLGVYSMTLNLTDLPFDQYSVRVVVADQAGNELSQTFKIDLKAETAIPWILQGNNIIYVSVGSALVIILVILFSVVVRKQVVNIGWKNEIVTVAYILNGLPCVYMMNKPEEVKGDMLFGGAMAGIRGVLEEITGEKTKMKLQTVDIGEKKVLICPGNYGDSVLMLNKIKPIHKEKIIDFTRAFERDYTHTLKQEDLLITQETFRGANILVQIHFGLTDSMELVDDCEDERFEQVELTSDPTDYYQQEQITPTHPITVDEPVDFLADVVDAYPPIEELPAVESQPLAEPIHEVIEVESIEKLVKQFPKDKQKNFVQIIQLTQNSLTALMEKKFNEANDFNSGILENLEALLTSEEIPSQMDIVLKTIFTITQQIYAGIEAGKINDEESYRAASEIASELWLKEITEKW
ncbi:MAG: hypothetical protein JJE41_05530 [Candidatus Heimdallarchaeota archaeon]|nr:hypothetical protein [Candidatus Heimdallarchaeota archaeon]